jgi:hypothetical protein
MMQECIEGDEREGRIEERRGKVKEQEIREIYTDSILHGADRPSVCLSTGQQAVT